MSGFGDFVLFVCWFCWGGGGVLGFELGSGVVCSVSMLPPLSHPPFCLTFRALGGLLRCSGLSASWSCVGVHAMRWWAMVSMGSIRDMGGLRKRCP